MSSTGGIGDRFFTTYAYLFTAAIIALISAFFFSFILGGYTVFNTDLGVREVDTSVSQLPFYLFGLSIPILSEMTVGDLFSALWVVYLLIFVAALRGQRRSLMGALKALHGRGHLPIYENSAFSVAVVFSILIVLFEAIELIQRSGGIQTGALPEANPIFTFTMISLSPLVEEVGFRATLIGGVVTMILLGRTGRFGSLKAVWHPSRYLEASLAKAEYQSLVYLVIALSGIFFGIAHISFGSGWQIGKVSTATISGVVLGWIYFKQGLPAAILLHWAFNYPAAAYVYFSCSLSGSNLCLQSADRSFIVSYFDSALLITGILSIGILLLYRYRGGGRAAKASGIEVGGYGEFWPTSPSAD